jgi:choline/glycine/proline betaine transport protein
MLAHPNRARVEAFIEQRVRPALAQVAEEIENINTSAQAELKEDRAELIIRHGGESDFRYAVKPQGYLKPTFAFPDLSDEDERRDRYFRAEVHLIEGGKGYDIFGYSKDQIIHDVLNQYHNHIQYLHLARA